MRLGVKPLPAFLGHAVQASASYRLAVLAGVLEALPWEEPLLLNQRERQLRAARVRLMPWLAEAAGRTQGRFARSAGGSLIAPQATSGLGAQPMLGDPGLAAGAGRDLEAGVLLPSEPGPPSELVVAELGSAFGLAELYFASRPA